MALAVLAQSSLALMKNRLIDSDSYFRLMLKIPHKLAKRQHQGLADSKVSQLMLHAWNIMKGLLGENWTTCDYEPSETCGAVTKAVPLLLRYRNNAKVYLLLEWFSNSQRFKEMLTVTQTETLMNKIQLSSLNLLFAGPCCTCSVRCLGRSRLCKGIRSP